MTMTALPTPRNQSAELTVSLDAVSEPIAPSRDARTRANARLTRLARRIDVPSRWALLAIGIWVSWRTPDLGGSVGWPAAMIAYALVAAITTSFWLVRGRQRADRLGALAAYLGYGADALFVAALIGRTGGLGSPFYLLFALLAMKAAALSLALPGMVWLPFVFGPLYAVVLRLQTGSFAFLAEPAFLERYLLVWLWLLAMVLVAWELARRSAQADALEAALDQQQVALAQKTAVLQRTATDLGDRVLELRSLQEVAKALATTLRTEETLRVIVERLRGITGSSHCAVALADMDAGALDGVLASETATRPFRLSLGQEAPTLTALRGGRVVRVGHEEQVETPLHRLLVVAEYSITPLVSRGLPIGAHYLADVPTAASDEDAASDAPGQSRAEQLLASFAYFAATAVENAQLYQDAWEKRRELEAVLAGIGDGVVVVDPDLHLILMNPVARHVLEVDEDPPVGVPLRPYLPAPAFADLLSDTLQSQREQIRELCLGGDDAGDTQRTYGALASPVVNADGQVSGVVAVLRDITAQKELERMKSNFLSVVSHELRTPLHSIRGFVEIILMGKTGPVTELQEDFLRTVRSQTIVLQRMIDDLLEFSRMEAGRVKVNVSEVPLPAMAKAVANKLVPLAEEGGLTLSLDMPEDLPEIDGDRVRLEQVLTNLVENAIKFTPSGGHIHVSGQQIGDRVRMTVADTGIGIPAEELERIFDRFYQVDSSERRAYRGTGLGLSICKHIVERHQGRIWAESDGIPGHGSRFHVELPIELHLEEAPTIDFTTPAR